MVDPHGATQAGVARPAVPQRHCDVSVWDLPASADPIQLLARLSPVISALASGAAPALAGLPTAELTVTVGLGPRLVGEHTGFRELAEFPVFPGDQVDPDRLGGDLLLQLCANDPLTLTTAAAEVARTIEATPKWRQTGFRGPATDSGAARNVLGFVDGIVNPRTDADLAREVWLDGDQAVRAGCVAVVRRMRLDVAGFLAQPVAEQERIFGRRRATAEPLSGGGPQADVDLGAKTPDGQYLIPAGAHVRRAHALTVGAGLMLRRSYNYDNGLDDRGVLFISFQRELRTFVATAHRMAEGDDLLRFATTTASAAFLILPGFTEDAPLGASLAR
ncbi:Dyp-type peroxidase [Goodfellowiella coeruleoviolacea]|uniref:Dye decolorizing peroxidase n=1 Tax=Goodfellowiella coeruleoviolacea TaxID=334858 RepID=A0AAE3GBE9_9PSEU|nr:Dyp-type peroxidase [Goodfellowiella coeruleoviolacea]MCP2164310.1 dye decolorizing peroxidase [Goodfellowiella coeruleoviolacea]